MTGEVAGAGSLHGGLPGDEASDRTGPLTVVIADDQALVRRGFRLILKAADIDVVAEAADGEQVVAAVLKYHPDVVLMDVRMPRLDGIEATRRIVAAWPQAPVPGDASAVIPSDLSSAASCPRVIILTTFDLDEYVYAALTAGASGFLLKEVTPEHLVAAVQLVRTGDALLAPSITRRLVERFASVPATSGAAGSTGLSGLTQLAGLGGTVQRPGTLGCDIRPLTPRELEVFGLVARGKSNAEIAASFSVSEATVKTHVARILTKLGLRDRVQAVVLAYESGLISPGTQPDV